MTEPRSRPEQIAEAEGAFDALVYEVSAKLEAGEAVDLDAIAVEHPEYVDRLGKLLPTLQAMAELGHADTALLATSQESRGPGELKTGVLGDFRILREIGRGGMGVVYEAQQVSLGRKVALKVLPFAAVLDPKQLQRFKNEAHAAAQLHHQNIVPVYWVGCERAVHFYAMQYVEGQTLAEVIRELRRIEGLDDEALQDRDETRPKLAGSLVSSQFAPPKASSAANAPTAAHAQETTPDVADETDRSAQAPISSERSTRNPAHFCSIAEIGVQVAEALDHAHEHGVIHRDVKPSNVILDVEGKAWVTDFGLARIETGATLTISGDLLGTVRYMSPEQALAKRVVVDHRTDVYSLGVTLYELLTLQPAFTGQDREELLRQIAFEDPKAPRRLNRSIPAELETIVLKAMAKNPAERYDTAQEVADELKRFREGRPIQARPITRVARAWRWCKRNRAVAGLGTVAAGLLLMLATAGPIVAVRQTRLRHEADDAAGRATYQANRATTLLRQKEQALNEAHQQRDRAETYLTMAMKALDEVVTRVGERDLEYVPQMEAVRREVLNDAAKFYEILLEKESSLGEETKTTTLRGELADAWLRVGEINRLMGANEEAEKAYDHAVSRFASLTKEFPKEPRYRLQLAKAHNGRGTVLASAKRVREAEKDVETAIRLVDELYGEAPDDPEYAHVLGALYQQRGTLFSDYHPPNEMFDLPDRLREAEESYSKAAEIIVELVEKNPEVPRYKDALAAMYRQQGERAVKEGRFAEAKEAYRQAVTCMDARVRQRPYSPSLRHALAMDCVGLAGALGADRQWREAQKSCQQAISLEERNRNEYPLVPHFRNGLAVALHDSAKLLVSRGKLGEARPLLQQAVTERLEALKPEKDNPVYRGGLSSDYYLLVQTLIGLRDHAAAADAALQFAQVYDRYGPSLHVATNFLVGCARLARADQALTSEHRENLAQDYLGLAKQMLDEAVADAEAHPHIPLGRWNMASYLAEPPEPELRDAARAVQIAEEVFDQLPDSWFFWCELAVIHYRAGNWEESLRAINEAHARQSAGTCTSWSLAAMAHWQLGHKEEARAWYLKLVARMEQTGCRNPEHHRFAREAAVLLGLAPSRVSGQSATSDESPNHPLIDFPGLETSSFQKEQPPEPLP